MNWESSPVTRAKSASRWAAGSSLVMSSFCSRSLAEQEALDGEVITQHEAEALTPVQGELGDQLVVGEVVFHLVGHQECCLKRAILPCSMALQLGSSSMVKAAGRFPLAAMRSW